MKVQTVLMGLIMVAALLYLPARPAPQERVSFKSPVPSPELEPAADPVRPRSPGLVVTAAATALHGEGNGNGGFQAHHCLRTTAAYTN